MAGDGACQPLSLYGRDNPSSPAADGGMYQAGTRGSSTPTHLLLQLLVGGRQLADLALCRGVVNDEKLNCSWFSQPSLLSLPFCHRCPSTHHSSKPSAAHPQHHPCTHLAHCASLRLRPAACFPPLLCGTRPAGVPPHPCRGGGCGWGRGGGRGVGEAGVCDGEE